MRNLEERLRAVEARVRGIPARFAGGGGAAVAPLPWLAALVYAGNELITSPTPVYGIKRKAGECIADGWKHPNRRATATCTITGGAIASLTLTDCGIGYPTPTAPVVTVTAPPSGGTQAVVAATLAADGDRVEGVYLTDCGTGYTTATVTFAAAPPGGVTATGAPVLRDGKVVAIRVTNKGRGYTTTPAVTIGGDGAGAAATAVRGVNTITLAVTNPGAGYTTAPTITVAAPPAGASPAPPTLADPAPDAWADGLGWGVINAGSLTGGVTAGSSTLIVHDDRGMVAYGLMGDGSGGAPYSRAPDSILSWYQTLVRLADADPDADGVLPAWVPMAGGV